MTSITLDAPAKVNLFLKVLSRRKDGYHNILTLFERISLCDRLRISKTHKGIRFGSDKKITADPKDNLVFRAADLILKEAGHSCGVDIRLEKHIPVAAGLGGGSSDAAATLQGINKLLRLRFNRDRLIKLGKKLGADVPFFLLERPLAIGSGRGDVFRPVRMQKNIWHLIVYPGFAISSARAYAEYDMLTRRPSDAKIQPSFGFSARFDELESMLYNDLGHAAVRINRKMGVIIERLAELLSKTFIVSGSGPSVFCLYRTGKEAITARANILRSIPASHREGWEIFVAKTN